MSSWVVLCFILYHIDANLKYDMILPCTICMLRFMHQPILLSFFSSVFPCFYYFSSTLSTVPFDASIHCMAMAMRSGMGSDIDLAPEVQ